MHYFNLCKKKIENIIFEIIIRVKISMNKLGVLKY